MIIVVINLLFVFVLMLSSTNTIVRASLGLGYHNGWGAYYRGLGLFVGVVALRVFGGLLMLAHHFKGSVWRTVQEVCFCCLLAGGPFECGGGYFCMLGHPKKSC